MSVRRHHPSCATSVATRTLNHTISSERLGAGKPKWQADKERHVVRGRGKGKSSNEGENPRQQSPGAFPNLFRPVLFYSSSAYTVVYCACHRHPRSVIISSPESRGESSERQGQHTRLSNIFSVAISSTIQTNYPASFHFKRTAKTQMRARGAESTT